MKALKLIALLLSVFAITAQAATTAELKAEIDAYGLTAVVSGNTVTVTGNKSDATSMLDLEIDGNVTVIWKAELSGGNVITLVRNSGSGTLEMQSGGIQNTALGGAIFNYSTGTVKISGGEVSAAMNGAVDNYSTGTVNISGGTVHSKGFSTVYNYGALNISGGTVLATEKKARAIYNDGGTVNISGEAIVQATGDEGYAVINDDGTVNINGGTMLATGDRSIVVLNYLGTININGGTIQSMIDNGKAVYNYPTAIINISGGALLAKNNCAIDNGDEDLSIIITGGFFFAYGALLSNVVHGKYDASSGNAVIVAWYKKLAITEYIAETNTDIFAFPSTATAVWDKRGGIAYANGENIGFMAIDGITVKDPPSSSSSLEVSSSSSSEITLSSSSSSGFVSSSSLEVSSSSSSETILSSSSSADGVSSSSGGETQIRLPQIANLGNISVRPVGNAIVLENLPSNAKIKMYNLKGENIYLSNSRNAQILAIPVQTKGMYIVKISLGSETKLLRIPVM